MYVHVHIVGVPGYVCLLCLYLDFGSFRDTGIVGFLDAAVNVLYNFFIFSSFLHCMCGGDVCVCVCVCVYVCVYQL